MECHEWVELGMKRAGLESELASRADQKLLRSFGMWKEWTSIVWPEGCSWLVRGSPRLGWMDGVKVALGTLDK